MQSFDVAAITYDLDFTDSEIGKLLRQIVWAYLEQVISGSHDLNILELNCGTGEDAIFFARKGHQITATDVSEEMIRITRQKVQQEDLGQTVKCMLLDIRELKEKAPGKTYDLVFSDFGGLNCLNPLELDKLAGDLGNLLKPGGRFIAVVMSRMCAWESFYFLSKLKFKKIFRRNTSKNIPVNVRGEMVNTWYYSPGGFEQIFRDKFRKIKLQPLGIFLPPSYTESFFQKNPRALDFLNKMESMVTNISAMARISDHFIIDFETR